MMADLLVPVDPEAYAIRYLSDLFIRVRDLNGYVASTDIPDGTVPGRFVRVAYVGNTEMKFGERCQLVLQVWHPTNDDYIRQRVARVLVAHMRRDLRAAKNLGPIRIPDPADATRQISQVSVTIGLLPDQEN